jgi:hypothetical protein
MNNTQQIIQDAIEKCEKNHGTKEYKRNLLELVRYVARKVKGFFTIKKQAVSYATSTTSNSTNTVDFSAMKKLMQDLESHNLSGLANELGITKEGVHRLIKLLDGVPLTKNGSGQYSSETISLVRDAIQKERILKQTTIQFASPRLWTKTKSQPTSKHWKMNAYGTKVM